MPHPGGPHIPVVASLLGPPLRGYQTIRFASLASAAFDDQYVVSDGPVNAKTGVPYGKSTKAYAEWLTSQDREVISTRDYGFITKLQKSVWLHDAASVLLDEGCAEGVIRTEYCGLPCQIRMDWFSEKYGGGVDGSLISSLERKNGSNPRPIKTRYFHHFYFYRFRAWSRDFAPPKVLFCRQRPSVGENGFVTPKFRKRRKRHTR